MITYGEKLTPKRRTKRPPQRKKLKTKKTKRLTKNNNNNNNNKTKRNACNFMKINKARIFIARKMAIYFL